MQEQRQRAREAGRRASPRRRGGVTAAWSEIRSEFGPTQFLGYQETEVEARVLAVVPSSVAKRSPTSTASRRPTAPSWSRSSWTGRRFTPKAAARSATRASITTSTGTVRVLDTTSVVEGLTRHLGYVDRGVDRGRAGGGRRDRLGSAGSRSGATTPAPTFCTGRCDRCSATTCASRARSSPRTACASTSATSGPCPRRRSAVSRTS